MMYICILLYVLITPFVQTIEIVPSGTSPGNTTVSSTSSSASTTSNVISSSNKFADEQCKEYGEYIASKVLSCQIICVSPDVPDSLIGLNFEDDTPCNSFGHCLDGECIESNKEIIPGIENSQTVTSSSDPDSTIIPNITTPDVSTPTDKITVPDSTFVPKVKTNPDGVTIPKDINIPDNTTPNVIITDAATTPDNSSSDINITHGSTISPANNTSPDKQHKVSGTKYCRGRKCVNDLIKTIPNNNGPESVFLPPKQPILSLARIFQLADEECKKFGSPGALEVSPIDCLLSCKMLLSSLGNYWFFKTYYPEKKTIIAPNGFPCSNNGVCSHGVCRSSNMDTNYYYYSY